MPLRPLPFTRPLALGALAMAALVLPALAQAPKLTVINTKRELSGALFGGGSWLAFTIDEEARDLNRDRDMDDTVVALVDLRTMTIVDPALATDPNLSDADEDVPIAVSESLIAIQVSEADQGSRDLNGNGRAQDLVLHVYNPATKQLTNLGVSGRFPTWAGNKLYFAQSEALAAKDLNGDKDGNDLVVAAYDPATRQVQNLQQDASGGMKATTGWVAAMTLEAAQQGKDLNGDGDVSDTVVQLYDIAKGTWTNTGLEGSTDVALTPKLLAVAVDELKQGGKDRSGDGDNQDSVCEVRNLATGETLNTGLDCREGLYADNTLVGMCVDETASRRDLNGDGDQNDVVAYAYTLGAEKTVNTNRDASGGMDVAGGKLAFGCSEADQGNKDLNRDMDTDDLVVTLYDPVRNAVTTTGYSMDGDLFAADGYLAWKVLESDQGNRDYNRDMDTDDSILHVMDVSNAATSSTGWACGDPMIVTARGVGFSTFESDQADRDLNADGDTDDEIIQFARIAK